MKKHSKEILDSQLFICSQTFLLCTIFTVEFINYSMLL